MLALCRKHCHVLGVDLARDHDTGTVCLVRSWVEHNPTAGVGELLGHACVCTASELEALRLISALNGVTGCCCACLMCGAGVEYKGKVLQVSWSTGATSVYVAGTSRLHFPRPL